MSLSSIRGARGLSLRFLNPRGASLCSNPSCTVGCWRWAARTRRGLVLLELAGAILRSWSSFPRSFSRYSPIRAAVSLSVRSGLLFFTAGHHVFGGFGRFSGAKPSESCVRTGAFCWELVRCVSGFRSVLAPNRGVRAPKCDGGRRKRVTQPTQKADT